MLVLGFLEVPAVFLLRAVRVGVGEGGSGRHGLIGIRGCRVVVIRHRSVQVAVVGAVGAVSETTMVTVASCPS